MRATSILVLSAVVLLSLACVFAPDALNPLGALPDSPSDPFPKSPTGFAVVELFTSEGCSSCPPADVVAEKIAERAAASGSPVYVLAYHVDYWNRLGWPDRFSSPEHTSRQRQYAATIADGRMYTPQIVVNGRDEFVGSRGTQADRAVRAALARTPEVRITLSKPRLANGKESIHVSGRVTGAATDGLVLQCAIVESGLVTEVERGENRGRTLHHARVVRAIRTIDIKSEFEVELPLASEVDRAEAFVVVFAQRKKTLEIVGAAERGVVEAPTSRPGDGVD